MNIRKAESSDLEKLTRLMIEFKESLNDYVQDSLRAFRVKERPVEQIKEGVRQELANPSGLFLVALERSDIVGFIFATIEESHHLVFEPVRRGLINQVWVRKDCRGKGISHELKEKVLSWFRESGCQFARLLVLHKNPAHEIYKRWGFIDEMDEMYLKL